MLVVFGVCCALADDEVNALLNSVHDSVHLSRGSAPAVSATSSISLIPSVPSELSTDDEIASPSAAQAEVVRQRQEAEELMRELEKLPSSQILTSKLIEATA